MKVRSNMSTEIYYFSGTGNSLFVAKELQKRIPEAKLIPIVSLLNQDTIKTQAEKVGIIFPLQGPTYPIAVKMFLEKIDLESADYIFAIATRGGTSCRIKEEINKILKKKGKTLNSHFIITMFNNDPKHRNDNKEYSFRIPSNEEIIDKKAVVRARIDDIQAIIENREESHKKDTECLYKYGFILEQIILLAIKSQESKSIKNYFYTDSKCIGCGLCDKICLSSRIKMKEGKPQWDENTLCYMCYACINFCPVKSIQINSKWYMKSYTATEGRYSHPFCSAKDIQDQKSDELESEFG